MGVLHMAIPTSSRYPGLKTTMRRLPRVAAHPLRQPSQQLVEKLQVHHQINPAPAPRGTLLPPTKSLEAKLERTPEQEAVQEAVAKLVRQCMAGDSQAWQQLVASQHRRIYAICYRFTGSGTDAEDLTQEVFLKLYKNLASFDTQKGSFQTWITTLARNLPA